MGVLDTSINAAGVPRIIKTSICIFPCWMAAGSYGLRVCGSSHSRLFALSSVMGGYIVQVYSDAGTRTPDVNVAFRSIVVQTAFGLGCASKFRRFIPTT